MRGLYALFQLLTWPAIVLLCIFAIVVENNESHKFAAFLTLVIGFVAWQFFGIPDQIMIYAAVAFVPIGLAWSIWRWKVYCKEKVEHYSNINRRSPKDDPRYSKEEILAELELYRHTDKLVSWVLAWPVSVIERMLGDIVRIVKTIVVEWCGNIYKKIASSAVDGLK